MFLQICPAFLLRELAEIDKQLDQKTQEKCCLCGFFVGLLKRGDGATTFAIANILLLALGKWGRTQMGSDGLNQILAGCYFSAVGAPLKTHDFNGMGDRILTGFHGIWFKSG